MKQTNKILREALTEVTAADTCIRETTDDQLVLWLASDALDRAAHDLHSAIEYANATTTVTTAEHIALRLQLVSIIALNKYIAILRLFPPQLLVFPLVATQAALMWGGSAWLLFGLHIPYWYVMPFVIFNLVTFPFTIRIPDRLVIWLLDKATELAQLAKHNLFLQHPTITSRIEDLTVFTYPLEDSSHDQFNSSSDRH